MKSKNGDMKIIWNVEGMTQKEFKEKMVLFLKSKNILFI